MPMSNGYYVGRHIYSFHIGKERVQYIKGVTRSNSGPASTQYVSTGLMQSSFRLVNLIGLGGKNNVRY